MSLSIAIAQVNPTVGDVAGNLAIVRRARDEAAAHGADLVVFSELALVGYPPEDLVLRPALVEAAAHALDALEHESASGPGLVVTLPWREGGCLHNAVALVAEGDGSCDSSTNCPTTASSTRNVSSRRARSGQPVTFGDVRLGLPICEDIWFPTVPAHLARLGAELLLVPTDRRSRSASSISAWRLRGSERARRGFRSSTSIRSAARTSSFSTAHPSSINGDGQLARQLPPWQELSS